MPLNVVVRAVVVCLLVEVADAICPKGWHVAEDNRTKECPADLESCDDFCCEPNPATCAGGTIDCGPERYLAYWLLANNALSAEHCCTGRELCSAEGYGCDAGYKKIPEAELEVTYCNGDVGTCGRVPSACCVLDRDRCGGRGITDNQWKVICDKDNYTNHDPNSPYYLQVNLSGIAHNYMSGTHSCLDYDCEPERYHPEKKGYHWTDIHGRTLEPDCCSLKASCQSWTTRRATGFRCDPGDTRNFDLWEGVDEADRHTPAPTPAYVSVNGSIDPHAGYVVVEYTGGGVKNRSKCPGEMNTCPAHCCHPDPRKCKGAGTTPAQGGISLFVCPLGERVTEDQFDEPIPARLEEQTDEEYFNDTLYPLCCGKANFCSVLVRGVYDGAFRMHHLGFLTVVSALLLTLISANLV